MNNIQNNQNNNQPPQANDMNNLKLIEDKIKSLEEQIAQKENELKILKQELYLNKAKKMMEINKMNDPPNNQLQDQNKISVNFQFDIKNNNLTCNPNEIASVLKDKLNFIYDYQPIDFSQTIEQNKISNGSTIKITDKIYKIRFLNHIEGGTTIFISLDENCPIRKAAKLFIQKSKNYGLLEKLSKDTLVFISNGIKLNVQKDTPIKEIFGEHTNPPVAVINTDNIIV